RRGREAGRASDAGAAEAAVATGVLGKVLLVIILGVVELRRVEDLGCDLVVAGRGEHALVGVTRGLGQTSLLWRGDGDPRAIPRADVVALAHALGRVVALPEDLQQRVVAHHRRIEDNTHDLVVAGEAGADFLVGGVAREAPGVPDGGGEHAGHRPEFSLGAPEA